MTQEQFEAKMKELGHLLMAANLEEAVNIYSGNTLGNILQKTPEEFEVIKNKVLGVQEFFNIFRNYTVEEKAPSA